MSANKNRSSESAKDSAVQPELHIFSSIGGKAVFNPVRVVTFHTNISKDNTESLSKGL